MRTAVIFFLFLCWYLAGGYSTATASDFHYRRSHAMTQAIENVRQVSTAEDNPFFLTTACNSLTEDIAHITSVEEDEEEDGTRKHISLARDTLAYPSVFLINHHFSYTSGSLSLGKHSSCINTPKYIIQRALRI